METNSLNLSDAQTGIESQNTASNRFALSPAILAGISRNAQAGLVLTGLLLTLSAFSILTILYDFWVWIDTISDFYLLEGNNLQITWIYLSDIANRSLFVYAVLFAWKAAKALRIGADYADEEWMIYGSGHLLSCFRWLVYAATFFIFCTLLDTVF